MHMVGQVVLLEEPLPALRTPAGVERVSFESSLRLPDMAVGYVAPKMVLSHKLLVTLRTLVGSVVGVGGEVAGEVGNVGEHAWTVGAAVGLLLPTLVHLRYGIV